ncbi:basic membrane lipoprotein [Alkalidesulfovibrio alkalitolerans DSM 16529]|uniref:Basic membrane lipoprotein n=1 Tax=Alkalidesulfovibrio alkalitolerans DSM 16529 TaxID=1121439 RepID=S7UKK3_9BACT|nr:BMP family ABC transporter substrate-binding protein [Alkalidesulfovibrio alkalitolerans]EPR34369.1 basic membrane lipoprotein [Alkalidesulfovibrio alkalitolerans DSM 16529]
MRTLMKVLLMAMLALALAACAEEKKEAPKTEAAAPAPAAEATPAAPEKKDYKVGFIYVSPVGDAGWSYAHDMGRQALEAMPDVTTAFVESVPEGPDSERVLNRMAREGMDVIFATSFGYMDPMQNVAKDFPNTVFMHCSGFKRADNVGTYFGRIYQARYLSGMVAGAMSASGKLGYVAAFPIPEVIRGINAFTLGAQKMNPEVEVRVVWTKTWYDPATEKEAAKALLDAGCDVIAQHQDSPGPQEAAQERGVYSVGYNTDMSAFAPKAHLTAPTWNWSVIYEYVLDQVRAGTWKSEDLWWGMDKGVVDLAPYGDMVPQDVRAKVDAAKAELVAGTDNVFAGPLFDQKGEQKVAEGERLSDGDLLGMMWFVKGVIGSTE